MLADVRENYGGELDLGSDNSGCARLGGSKVPPPLGVVKEKVVVVVVLVRRHRCENFGNLNTILLQCTL